jgi:hypothetical protein
MSGSVTGAGLRKSSHPSKKPLAQQWFMFSLKWRAKMRQGTSFRLMASDAARQAKEATDQADALRLLQMAHYWISAADNEDWLNANSIHHPVRSPGSD